MKKVVLSLIAVLLIMASMTACTSMGHSMCQAKKVGNHR